MCVGPFERVLAIAAIVSMFVLIARELNMNGKGGGGERGWLDWRLVRYIDHVVYGALMEHSFLLLTCHIPGTCERRRLQWLHPEFLNETRNFHLLTLVNFNHIYGFRLNTMPSLALLRQSLFYRQSGHSFTRKYSGTRERVSIICIEHLAYK